MDERKLFALDKELLEEAEKTAKGLGISFSALVRMSLIEKMQRMK